MTHDELLARMSSHWVDQNDEDIYKALCAVVELHKPHSEHSDYCAGCETDDPWYWYEYPCPTIQAIEKELL